MWKTAQNRKSPVRSKVPTMVLRLIKLLLHFSKAVSVSTYSSNARFLHRPLGVESGQVHITGDLITALFRSSTRGATPRNSWILDGLYDFAAYVCLSSPFWLLVNLLGRYLDRHANLACLGRQKGGRTPAGTSRIPARKGIFSAR